MVNDCEVGGFSVFFLFPFLAPARQLVFLFQLARTDAQGSCLIYAFSVCGSARERDTLFFLRWVGSLLYHSTHVSRIRGTVRLVGGKERREKDGKARQCNARVKFMTTSDGCSAVKYRDGISV